MALLTGLTLSFSILALLLTLGFSILALLVGLTLGSFCSVALLARLTLGSFSSSGGALLSLGGLTLAILARLGTASFSTLTLGSFRISGALLRLGRLGTASLSILATLLANLSSFAIVLTLAVVVMTLASLPILAWRVVRLTLMLPLPA